MGNPLSVLVALILAAAVVTAVGQETQHIERLEKAVAAGKADDCANALSDYAGWLVEEKRDDAAESFSELFVESFFLAERGEDGALFVAEVIGNYYGNQEGRYDTPFPLDANIIVLIKLWMSMGVNSRPSISQMLTHLKSIYDRGSPEAQPVLGLATALWMQEVYYVQSYFQNRASTWFRANAPSPDFARFVQLGQLLAEPDKYVPADRLRLENEDWAMWDTVAEAILADASIAPRLRMELGRCLLFNSPYITGSPATLRALQGAQMECAPGKLSHTAGLDTEVAQSTVHYGATATGRSAGIDLITSWWDKKDEREAALGTTAAELSPFDFCHLALLLSDRQEEASVRAVIDKMVVALDKDSISGSFDAICGLIAVGEFDLAREALPAAEQAFALRTRESEFIILNSALSKNLLAFQAELNDPAMALRLDVGILSGMHHWRNCVPPQEGTHALAQRVIMRKAEILALPQVVREELCGDLGWRASFEPHLHSLTADMPFPELMSSPSDAFFFAAKLKGLLAERDWAGLESGLNLFLDQVELGEAPELAMTVTRTFYLRSVNLLTEILCSQETSAEELQAFLFFCYHFHAAAEEAGTRSGHWEGEDNIRSFGELAAQKLASSYDLDEVRTRTRTSKGRDGVGERENSSYSSVVQKIAAEYEPEAHDPATSEATTLHHARRLLISEAFCEHFLKHGPHFSVFTDFIPNGGEAAVELGASGGANNPFFQYLAARHRNTTNHLSPLDEMLLWQSAVDGFDARPGNEHYADLARLSFAEMLLAQGGEARIPEILDGLTPQGKKAHRRRIKKLQ